MRPTPNPSPTPTPTETPTPSPTVPPVVPTPPPVEDPKNVIYVDPVKPTNVDPKTFEKPPASPVVVTKEPTFGEITVNNNGTFTYTPPATPPAAPVVDVVEFQYTNLSGEAVVVRKEFVMTYKGDVPSIIQTGGTPLSNSLALTFLLLLVTVFTISRFSFFKKGHNNA